MEVLVFVDSFDDRLVAGSNGTPAWAASSPGNPGPSWYFFIFVFNSSQWQRSSACAGSPRTSTILQHKDSVTIFGNSAGSKAVSGCCYLLER
ncbi:hypothetical protein TYRP_023260 [Tyrophagus putrescentiae]|nr:hypothetical protein TYRP_023260 [Tyrophagus putrescentiae]